jgi:hypothetical protein
LIEHSTTEQQSPILVQDIARKATTNPILVRKSPAPMNHSNALSKKSPVLQIKRFFSEPWFGFCNLPVTAPYLHWIPVYQWRYQSWRRPTSACDSRLAWNRNVPKEVKDFNDY